MSGSKETYIGVSPLIETPNGIDCTTEYSTIAFHPFSVSRIDTKSAIILQKSAGILQKSAEILEISWDSI